ncbi:MAG: hypothetical protein Q4B60_05255 [Erysipelotrichaceae bacterium]|nr:hypothetical protein [Erysipelotrichaceae bacterium]
MSRLGKMINITQEKTIDVSKMNLSSAFTSNKGSLDETIKVSMNLICGRFKNDYIIDPSQTKVLIKSIEKEGLLQPIVLMNIEDYLASNNVLDDEKEYYTSMLDKGFTYFIVAGHRRFRAYASLLSGELIETNDALENFYKKIKDESTEIGSKFIVQIGKKSEEPWTKILAIIANPDNLDEILAYLHSNITARNPSQFEIIASVYNQLVRTGELEKMFEHAKSQDKRAKENAVIVDYINKQYAIKVDKGWVSKTTSILKKVNPKIVECIYEGKVGAKAIAEILPIYELIVESNQEELLLNEIENKKFKSSNWKKKFADANEEKEIKSPKFIDVLMKIKNGDMSIDEAIELYK